MKEELRFLRGFGFGCATVTSPEPNLMGPTVAGCRWPLIGLHVEGILFGRVIPKLLVVIKMGRE